MSIDLHTSRRHIMAGLAGCSLNVLSSPVVAHTHHHGFASKVIKLDPLLADIHKRTFFYFWETAHPVTGLSPDNWPNPKFCSIAATGFALSSYCIGVHSGYVTREAAVQKTLTVLRLLRDGPQHKGSQNVMGYKGFFYHFLQMDTGLRYKDCELSSVDTALLICGVLTAAAFFDGHNSDEAEIRSAAMSLYQRIDWTFMARDNGLISMGWHPETVVDGKDETGLNKRSWDRYNEGKMVYLLGLGSPTHPLPAKSWANWAATIEPTYGPNYGQPHIGFSPMFGHQYSEVWFDLRGMADATMRKYHLDYFTNSVRATLAQRNYAIKNPAGFKGYSQDIWGLTASRGPGEVSADIGGHRVEFHEYGARGPQTGDGESFDDGTIAPTAMLGSIAFAPDYVIPSVHALQKNYGKAIYGPYGFYDAFNPSFAQNLPSKSGHWTSQAGWVSKEYLGIDQGPILTMMENYRSGLIWTLFCKSKVTGPIVRKALLSAGFEPISQYGQWIKAPPIN